MFHLGQSSEGQVSETVSKSSFNPLAPTLGQSSPRKSKEKHEGDSFE